MKVTIQKKCVRVELGENGRFNSYAKGVLLYNRISGIIPATLSEEGGRSVLLYDVSGCGRIQDVFGGFIAKDKMLGVLRDICNTIVELKNYGISQDMLFLHKDMVWYRTAQQETELILLPVKRRTSENLGEFMKKLLTSMSIGSGTQAQYAFDIVSYINRTADVTPELILNYLDSVQEIQIPDKKSANQSKMMEEGINPNLVTPPVLSIEINEPEIPPVKMDSQANVPVREMKRSQGSKQKPVDMSMLCEDDILGTKASEMKYNSTEDREGVSIVLIQKSNNRFHTVYQSGATIGTLSQNQIIVQNTKVSRHHAAIFYRDGQWLLMIDDRSKNASYLNGRRIEKGTSAALADGDHFWLANEEFEVQI